MSVQHIAVIPDGNRRWAKEKGKNASEGHIYAANNTVPLLIDHFLLRNIPYVTLWALSTENLVNRPKIELDILMRLLRDELISRLRTYGEQGVRLQFMGDIEGLPKDVQNVIRQATDETKENTKFVFNLGLNYGGRNEIIRAVNKLQKDQIDGPITDDIFSSYLDTAGIPDPDIIIRTGKEKRFSGFMPWQSVYSELFFEDCYFPDLTPERVDRILEEYGNRDIRKGK